MIEFRINLIRDRVPSAARRRRRYWAIIVYLAAAGMVLTMALGVSAARLTEARLLRRQQDRLEEKFRAAHGDGGTIRTYAADAEQQMINQLNTLRAVNARLAETARPAELIYALLSALPEQSSLQRFSLNNEERTVTFDVMIMGGGAGRGGGAADLVTRWTQDLQVSAHLEQISFLGSQMDGNVLRKDMVWRFSGQLKRQGS